MIKITGEKNELITGENELRYSNLPKYTLLTWLYIIKKYKKNTYHF